MTQPFPTVRAAALALLTDADVYLSRKAGSFLGQCAVDNAPLTPKQSEWLATLLSKAGLPSLADGGAND